MADGDQHVLIVDDEAQIRQFVRAGMELGGYRVTEAANGNDALREITLHPIDLVILDLALPDIDGSELLERIRGWSGVPVIILSVRAGETEKVKLLELGADDYVVKPFAIEELRAHIRAALRRFRSEQPLPKVELPELTIDVEKRLVEVRGERVHLTPKEFDVLRVLVTQQGKLITHARLNQIVWGPDHREETEHLRVVIRQLRKKMEKDPAHPQHILTEPWLGYRFQLPSLPKGKKSPRGV